MTMPVQRSRYLQSPSSSGLYEILDLILEKGLVIDAFVRVSVIGIEILTIEARIVVASVDTYLRYAEAVTRLGLTPADVHGRPKVLREVAQTVVQDDLRGSVIRTGERLERAVEHAGDVLLHHHPDTGITSVQTTGVTDAGIPQSDTEPPQTGPAAPPKGRR